MQKEHFASEQVGDLTLKAKLCLLGIKDSLIKPVLQGSLIFHYSLATEHFPISPLQWGPLSTALKNIDHLFLSAMQMNIQLWFASIKW